MSGTELGWFYTFVVWRSVNKASTDGMSVRIETAWRVHLVWAEEVKGGLAGAVAREKWKNQTSNVGTSNAEFGA